MVKKAALILALAMTAALAGMTPALASHAFVIINAGAHTAEHISISGVNRRMWGPDLLGRYVLKPGGRASFSIGEGCLEDVRIIYTNNYTVTRGAVNTCSYNLRLNY